LPELPEIEVLRQSLAPLLVGARLEVVRVGRHDMRSRGRGRLLAAPPGGERRAGGSRAPGRPWMDRASLLHGALVKALHRHGKQLAIEAADGRVLVVQLGMSGQVLLEGEGLPAVPRTHRHVEWRVQPRRGAAVGLVFRDPRRFGGVHAAPSLRDLRADAWRDLGPDALRIQARTLATALASARPIKAALLDQECLAGVGNIYADEALFHARIAPRTLARSLKGADIARLAAGIRLVLAKGVRLGGSTLRDHRSAMGALGEAQRWHRVYGRGGLPCLRCGAPLRSTRLAGRATVHCPGCQGVSGRRAGA